MPGKAIAKYLHPWMFQRDKKQQRYVLLRQRDGDNCWRCRRPLCFDAPRGSEQASTIEHILPKSKGGTSALDNLCLCHGRCNWMMADNTPEVKERMRAKENEAQRRPAVAARKRKVA